MAAENDKEMERRNMERIGRAIAKLVGRNDCRELTQEQNFVLIGGCIVGLSAFNVNGQSAQFDMIMPNGERFVLGRMWFDNRPGACGYRFVPEGAKGDDEKI